MEGFVNLFLQVVDSEVFSWMFFSLSFLSICSLIWRYPRVC